MVIDNRPAHVWVSPPWWLTRGTTSGGTATTTSTSTASGCPSTGSTFSTPNTLALRSGFTGSQTLSPTHTGDFSCPIHHLLSLTSPSGQGPWESEWFKRRTSDSADPSKHWHSERPVWNLPGHRRGHGGLVGQKTAKIGQTSQQRGGDEHFTGTI